jgi:16S rRNA (cytosine967-C5)-methyltransferase
LRIEQGAFSSRLLGSKASPGVRSRLLGVLRWQRALSHVLASLVRRRFDRLDAEVRVTLAIGLFELTQLGVPPAVATDGAIHLVRKLGKGSAGSMINAVLRRAQAAWQEQLASAPPDLILSHPEWLFQRWVDSFGAATAEQIMTVNQQPAATWVWFADETGRHRLQADGVELRPHPWCPDSWTAPANARALMAAVESGAAYAQDPASQLVAQILLGLAADSSGSRLLDLCAAPGGKIALLLKRRRWPLAAAADLQPTRLGLVRKLLSRSGSACHLLVANAEQAPLRPRSWDLVMLDAPCSGTGTLRRHPELRWRLTPGRISRLAETQEHLIASALDLLSPNGILVYSTCSIEPEENQDLLKALPDGIQVEAIDRLMPESAEWRQTSSGGACLPPGADNDGFTIHALCRHG